MDDRDHTDPATDHVQGTGGKMSRRKVLGGIAAAGVGAAAASALAVSCGSKEGTGTAGGDGPPGFGTGINEGFDGKI